MPEKRPGRPPQVSVILSTYEKPAELALALRALAASRGIDAPALEIVVADDGSGAETAQVVETFRREADSPVRHARHPDEGFRLAAIRNRAVRLARGEVLVFLDGDSLALPGTLARHLERCRPGVAHAGARCHLGQRETTDLLEGRLAVERATERACRRDRWQRYRRYVADILCRATRLKPRPKLVAGNCAVHRTDFDRVNGFNERFVGWGLEDDDLRRRLRRVGVRIRDGSLDCLALHLFHPAHASHFPTVRDTWNHRYYHRTDGYLTRCRLGLRRRPLEEIAVRVVGELPPSLAALASRCGRADPRQRAEVALVAPGARAPRRGSAELVVRLPDRFLARGPDATREAAQYLEEFL